VKLFAKSRAARLTARQEALAGRIAAGITGRQRRLANWLNGKTATLPARTWIFLLLGFCLSFGMYCLYLLVSALK